MAEAYEAGLKVGKGKVRVFTFPLLEYILPSDAALE
jgi:hypothetical protein